jgi:GGDEF domain-containing protein
MIVRTTNLADINEQSSRSVGNIVLASYLETLLSSFCTDNLLFRLSGTEFLAISTNYNKMGILDPSSLKQSNFLDYTSNVGSITHTLHIKAGIARSDDASNESDLVGSCYKALKVACAPGFDHSYCYYKDIA